MSQLTDDLMKLIRIDAWVRTGDPRYLEKPMIHGFTSPEKALAMHENQEREAGLDALMERDAKVDEAKEQIRSEEGLKTILNDEEFAPSLSAVMNNLEGATYELEQLKKGLQPQETIALSVVLQALAQTERQLFLRAMGE